MFTSNNAKCPFTQTSKTNSWTVIMDSDLAQSSIVLTCISSTPRASLANVCSSLPISVGSRRLARTSLNRRVKIESKSTDGVKLAARSFLAFIVRSIIPPRTQSHFAFTALSAQSFRQHVNVVLPTSTLKTCRFICPVRQWKYCVKYD